MTKPTYSELEAENLRVRGLLQRLVNAGMTVVECPQGRVTAYMAEQLYLACEDAKPALATIPQSSSLVPQEAESADIGKLDTADENVYDESTDFCAKLMASSLAPVRTPQLKSGVEMGKVNRVEGKADA